MGTNRSKLLWGSLLAALLSGGLLLVVVGYLGLVVYTALATGTPIAGMLLDLAVPYLVIVAALVTVIMLSSGGIVWALVRSASVPRSTRLQAVAEWVERMYPPTQAIGLSEIFAPPEPSAEAQAEQALAQLQQQYVDGELTETEFERRVDRLVATESLNEARVDRERRKVLDDPTNEDRP
jgi:hypothetical protein